MAERDREDRAFAEVVGRLVELRRTHPLLRQTRYLHGEPTDAGLANVTWLAAEGRAMTAADWHDPRRRCFGLMLAGEGGLLAILLNADQRPCRFVLPRHGGSAGWRTLLDTADPTAAGLAADPLPLAARSLVLLEVAEAQTTS